MQRKRLTMTLQQYSFWLALCIHLFLLLSLSVVFIPKKLAEPSVPDLFIPSYAYDESAKTVIQQPKTVVTQQTVVPTSKLGIQKPTTQPVMRQPLTQVLDSASNQSTEPVHLLGEKGVAKPLIVLLGKALTKKLIYPRIALDFQLRGEAVIGFVLHPDGKVTNVKLLKSSRAEVLDKAALAAANQISPIKGAGDYVKEPQSIVFGIVFGSR